MKHTKMSIKISLCLALLFGSSHINAQSPPVPQTLHYNKPATEWLEALPLGNGSLGAIQRTAGDNNVFNAPYVSHRVYYSQHRPL